MDQFESGFFLDSYRKMDRRKYLYLPTRKYMDIFVYSYAASLETPGGEMNHFEGDLSFDS